MREIMLTVRGQVLGVHERTSRDGRRRLYRTDVYDGTQLWPVMSVDEPAGEKGKAIEVTVQVRASRDRLDVWYANGWS